MWVSAINELETKEPAGAGNAAIQRQAKIARAQAGQAVTKQAISYDTAAAARPAVFAARS